MDLCPRHDDALVMALELRGLLRPIFATGAIDKRPLIAARQAIAVHATNLAGRASIDMLTGKNPEGGVWCPLCFVNATNPLGMNLDSWVDNAADEAVADRC